MRKPPLDIYDNILLSLVPLDGHMFTSLITTGANRPAAA